MAVIMQKVLVAKQKPEIPVELPTMLADVLRRCFSSDPHKRPNFVDMLPVLQRVLGMVTSTTNQQREESRTERPETKTQATAQARPRPRLVQAKAGAVARVGDVEQLRPAELCPGKNAGQWVEERRHERINQARRDRATTGHNGREDLRKPGSGDPAKTEPGHRDPRFHRDHSQAAHNKWIEYKDPKTGRPYDYNKATRKTVW
jgi:hypothetical protein